MKKNIDLIQVLTNLAVVVGLLLLIYELNQSRDLTRAQLVDAAYSSVVSRNLSVLGENPQEAIAKSVFRPEEVSESDAVVLAQFYTALLVSWLRNKDERGLGFFGQGYEEVIASEAYFINTVPGRKWWAATRDFTDPAIAAAVDRALEKITPEGQRDYFELLLGKKGQRTEREASTTR